MDMTVFYTKNGVNLGIAFRDIKNDYLYYPAIGLRTPGEVVEANFGQKKFKFDIENCIKVKVYYIEKLKLSKTLHNCILTIILIIYNHLYSYIYIYIYLFIYFSGKKKKKKKLTIY